MKPFGAVLCALLILAIVFPAPAAETMPGAEEADAFFAALFNRAQAVNGIVLIGRDETPFYQYAHGWANKKSGLRVDEKTVFKVASVTKMVSAVGLMKLSEQGALGLDDPLADLLHPGLFNPAFPETPVTARQLLSHTSSLLPSAPYAPSPRWESDEKRSSYFSKQRPGTAYVYVNLDGGLIGCLIERLSGLSVNTYMQKNVFAPLGINAAYAAPLLPDGAYLSGTYTESGETYISAARYLEQDAAYEDTCDPLSHTSATVGSLYISGEGLLKIAMMLSGGGALDGVKILEGATVAAMRMEQNKIPQTSVTGKSPYGLGLYRLESGEETWWGHQGRWKGMLCDVFFERESHTAVVFIMNGVRHLYGYETDPFFSKALGFISDWLNVGQDDFLIR